MKQLHSKKGQGRTLPASLWMCYKAVRQNTFLAGADDGTANSCNKQLARHECRYPIGLFAGCSVTFRHDWFFGGSFCHFAGKESVTIAPLFLDPVHRQIGI